jgi:hypothetical protein
MSLFDTVITASDSEAPAFRQAPEGNYLVTVRSAKKVVANSGTEGIELQFTMMENLDDGADMEGVDLSKTRLRNTLWVTENTVERVRRDLARISPETAGETFTAALDILPGSEVVVRVKHITEDRQGKALRTPWLDVSSYYTKDWYFENRLKAA